MKKILSFLILIQITIGTAFSQTIAAGGNNSLAVCTDSTAMAWGHNFYGALGNGSNTASNVPVQVRSLTGIIAVAGGGFHSLALRSDGTVWACGYNAEGQLGDGRFTHRNVSLEISSLTG